MIVFRPKNNVVDFQLHESILMASTRPDNNEMVAGRKSLDVVVFGQKNNKSKLFFI